MSQTRIIQPNGASPAGEQRIQGTPTDVPSPATPTSRPGQPSVTGLSLGGNRPNSSSADTPFDGSDTSSVPMSNGPMNSKYVIPPRAKPGRKPATEDPDSKRKAQNRAAQRAFRQRKQDMQQERDAEAKTLREQLQVSEQNALLQQQRADNAEQALAANQQQIARMEADIRRLNDQLLAQSNELDRLRNVMLPMNTSRMMPHGFTAPQPVQTEFRSQIFASQPPPHAAPVTPPSEKPLESSCGDCEKTGNCPCVDNFVVDTAGSRPISTQIPPPISRTMSVEELCSPTSQALETDFTSFRPTAPAVSNAEFSASLLTGPIRLSSGSDSSTFSSMPPPPPPIRGAGTCDACQRDPERKRMCEELASSRPFMSMTTNGTRRFSSIDQALTQDTNAPSAKRQMISCPEATTLLRMSRQESTSSELSNLTAILGDIVQWPEDRRATGYGIELMEGADTLLKLRASFSLNTPDPSGSSDDSLGVGRSS